MIAARPALLFAAVAMAAQAFAAPVLFRNATVITMDAAGAG